MKPHMTIPMTPLAAACLLAVSGSALGETLTILHTNDFHSRVEPISRYDGPCTTEDNEAGECFGGWARLESAVERAKQETPDALLLDGGDQFQGSLFYTQYQGKVAAEMMNSLGYDAMTVGNHEFDDGPEVLARFIDTVDFPVLMSNADVADDSALAGKVVKSTVVEKAGQRYGLIGLTPEDTGELSSPGEKVRFRAATEAVQQEVDRLGADGVDRIIVLSHSGYQKDLDIAAAVSGVDVIVGGHSNTYLSSTDEDAVGPYPTMVDSTAVVQAYAYGKYLGRLTVSFDADGTVSNAQGEPLVMDQAVPEKAAVVERVAELAEPFQELLTQVVGKSSGTLEGGDACRTAECSFGNLIADAMVDRVADQGVTIGLMNGGGIRTSIESGDITMGELLGAMPFRNTLSTFRISGENLRSALENGVSEVAEGSGRFPQVSGLQYSFDPSRPAGERITDVELVDGKGSQPLDPEAIYSVVTNDYIRRGGDGYAMFAEGAMDPYDFGPNLETVVADYLQEQTDYQPSIQNRITRVD